MPSILECAAAQQHLIHGHWHCLGLWLGCSTHQRPGQQCHHGHVLTYIVCCTCSTCLAAVHMQWRAQGPRVAWLVLRVLLTVVNAHNDVHIMHGLCMTCTSSRWAPQALHASTLMNASLAVHSGTQAGCPPESSARNWNLPLKKCRLALGISHCNWPVVAITCNKKPYSTAQTRRTVDQKH